MNISLDKQANCIATLRAEIPSDRVTKERNQVLQGFMQQARIPGYRPGKAPKSVIEKRHGEAITQEVESRLFRETFSQAVKENENLKILNVKPPQDVTHQADGTFTFTADLVLAPEFELPEYKNLEIEIPKLEITDENVDEQLNQLQARFADYEDIDSRPIENGDLVVIDYTSTIDGQPLDEVAGEQAKTLASNEGYWIRIEDEAFFPGFTNALIGAEPGDEKEITVTLPNDFPIESIREQEAVFQVKVQSLKKKLFPRSTTTSPSKSIPKKISKD